MYDVTPTLTLIFICPVIVVKIDHRQDGIMGYDTFRFRGVGRIPQVDFDRSF